MLRDYREPKMRKQDAEWDTGTPCVPLQLRLLSKRGKHLVEARRENSVEGRTELKEKRNREAGKGRETERVDEREKGCLWRDREEQKWERGSMTPASKQSERMTNVGGTSKERGKERRIVHARWSFPISTLLVLTVLFSPRKRVDGRSAGYPAVSINLSAVVAPPTLHVSNRKRFSGWSSCPASSSENVTGSPTAKTSTTSWRRLVRNRSICPVTLEIVPRWTRNFNLRWVVWVDVKNSANWAYHLILTFLRLNGTYYIGLNFSCWFEAVISYNILLLETIFVKTVLSTYG